MMRHAIFVSMIMANLAFSAGVRFENLAQAQLLKMTRKAGCSYIHVWAAWCNICVEGLPSLLTFLESEKTVRPIIVDLSLPLARDKFSRPWLEKLSPKFKIYYKPEVPDEDYVKGIGLTWSGALPQSVLFKKGKKIKQWQGSVPKQELKEVFHKECQ